MWTTHPDYRIWRTKKAIGVGKQKVGGWETEVGIACEETGTDWTIFKHEDSDSDYTLASRWGEDLRG